MGFLQENPIQKYNPDERQVQQEDTVSSQLNNLLAGNSQYIQQARQSGKEYAASRGTLNSSMAAGAAQRAAIQAALPIAQQDASTFFNQGITNQTFRNDANKTNAGTYNQFLGREQEGGIQRGLIRTQGDVERGLIGTRTEAERGLIGARTDAESRLLGEQARFTTERDRSLFQQQQQLNTQNHGFEMARQQLVGEQQQALASADNEFRNKMQSSASMATMYANFNNQLAEIMGNKDIPEDVKQRYISDLITSMNAATQAQKAISGLNIPAMFATGSGRLGSNTIPQDQGQADALNGISMQQALAEAARLGLTGQAAMDWVDRNYGAGRFGSGNIPQRPGDIPVSIGRPSTTRPVQQRPYDYYNDDPTANG